ncbi:MAG: hypothetical protein Kow00121_46260 [Elainellaceae cyanobacterium]
MNEWDQERQQALEEQRLEIIKTLNDCEKVLIHESEPKIKRKLKNDILDLKEQLNNCHQELDSLQNRRNLQKSISGIALDISFQELDFVITGLLNLHVPPLNNTEDFLLTGPESKMFKNDLTPSVRGMIAAGLAQATEVNHFIQNIAKMLFPNVPERLIATLRMEYERLTGQGVTGDALFMDMYNFVSCHSPDPRRQIAGLAVLCYFFHTCDVFEHDSSN